ncbi:hypothetical protein ACYOEI_18225 [Singulisphaera rosea]
MLIPMGVKSLFPGRRGAIELTAIILPIVALLIRFRAGKRHINANHCSHRIKLLQLGVFCLGVLPLVLTDCFFILSDLMPGGAFAAPGDRVILASLYSLYLVTMIVAMYPGRPDPSDVFVESFDPHDSWVEEFEM